MGAAAIPLAIASTVASAGLQGYMQVQAGKAAKAQAYSEAELATRQAQDVDLQALQNSEQRREQLRSAMATIEARRAASGVGLSSPSGDAIMAEVQRQSQRAEAIDRVGYNNQRTSLLTGAAMKRQYGSQQLGLGYLQAGATLAGATGKIAGMGGGSKAGRT